MVMGYCRPGQRLLDKFHFVESDLPNMYVTSIVPGYVTMLLCFNNQVSVIDERSSTDPEELEYIRVMHLIEEDREEGGTVFRLNKVNVNNDEELDFMLTSIFGLIA